MSAESQPDDLIRHIPIPGWRQYTNEQMQDQVRWNTNDGIVFKGQLIRLGSIIAALGGAAVPAYLLLY